MTRRPEARIRLSESKKQLYGSGWQPRRYRKVDDGTLRRLAKDGVDMRRVARLAGLSIDQTRRRLQALGLLPPHRRRRLVNRHRLLALRREGMWPIEIARRLGIKAQLVRKILSLLRRDGVEIPTPSRPRPNKRRRMLDEDFLRAFRRGGTTARIAARLGVSRAYVIYKTYFLRRRGRIPPVRRCRIPTRPAQCFKDRRASGDHLMPGMK
ncbi:MAG: hypothetical protein ACREE7_18360, partial [Dongiaceae bacterium]